MEADQIALVGDSLSNDLVGFWLKPGYVDQARGLEREAKIEVQSRKRAQGNPTEA